MVLHHYGQEGRDLKKLSTNGVLLDMEMFQQMASQPFIDEFKKNIDKFIEYLNQNRNNDSPNTLVSDVKSFAFATIDTSDPNISMALTLEVYFFTHCFYIYFYIFIL